MKFVRLGEGDGMRHYFEIDSAAGGGGELEFEAHGVAVELLLWPVDAADAGMTLDIVEVFDTWEDSQVEETRVLEAQVTVDANKEISLGTLLADGETQGGAPYVDGKIRVTIAGAGGALAPALRGVLKVF